MSSLFQRWRKEQLLAKPNFSFQKRQKEIARQKKKEEKKQRKQEKVASPGGDQQGISGEQASETGAPSAGAGSDGIQDAAG